MSSTEPTAAENVRAQRFRVANLEMACKGLLEQVHGAFNAGEYSLAKERANDLAASLSKLNVETNYLADIEP